MVKHLLSLSIYLYLPFTLRIAVILLLFLHISLSHFLFITVTLSVSSFPPISSHTIPLLFSTQVRSFTGSSFSDEFDEDNQMAKDHTIAYGI